MNIHRRFLLFLLAASCAADGWCGSPLAQEGGNPPTAKTVSLIIDYGDGFEKHYTNIAHRERMTILDVMRRAEKHVRPLPFRFRGKEATAFLTEIDGLANEGSGRNWIYRVNDKLGDRSFAVYELAAGDVVRWRFGGYDK